MLGRTYDKEVCSAARALEIVGERWSLLILRNAAFAGMTRFTDFQKSLDIAPNVLAARLERFVETGLMATSDGPAGQQTYHLTKKGLDFKPVIMALTEWGDRWAAPDGPPIVYQHEGCGGRVRPRVYCKTCGESLRPQDVRARKTAVMGRLQEQRKARPARTRRDTEHRRVTKIAPRISE
jgi:DNA-binding HxlR family transcriptional regulator